MKIPRTATTASAREPAEHAQAGKPDAHDAIVATVNAVLDAALPLFLAVLLLPPRPWFKLHMDNTTQSDTPAPAATTLPTFELDGLKLRTLKSIPLPLNPADVTRKPRGELLLNGAIGFAHALLQHTPPGPQQNVALAGIEAALHDAFAALAETAQVTA